jgi:MoaA/NifB/PqqE/SkfB family radical SAM enzyme
MSVKNSLKNTLPMTETVASNPQMLKITPAILRFFCGYMNKFQIQKVGNYRILHSHLPPLNSKAYTRFINEHILSKTAGPSHAQIGLTNACPQNCEYCYNRTRSGRTMDTAAIKKVAQELKHAGVVWFGLTGGEPLLNKDIVEIIESVSNDCAVKLFTTGCTLTLGKASDLKNAGLFSVSVSLDSSVEQIHDQVRRYPGAFKQALNAIELFQKVGGVHVGVSAVLSREMIGSGEVETFLEFLKGLGVHEAWLSEVKPSIAAFQNSNQVITDEERLKLVEMQNSYNSKGKMTVNYLGHFEGKECFGCNAGKKMVYVDAFGDVSPCVFTPLNFGNVQTASIADILAEMKAHFPSEDGCFINKNYKILQKYSNGQKTLNKQETLTMLEEVRFGGLSKFNQLYYRAKGVKNNTVGMKSNPLAGESI